MAKCSVCKKAEVVDTPFDKITEWLFRHIFPKHYEDLTEEKYTRGFGEGYVTGVKAERGAKEERDKLQAAFISGNAIPFNENLMQQQHDKIP